MKYPEIPFYAYGFSDSDLGLFGEENRQLQLIKVTDKTFRTWLGKGDLSICVMHIQDEDTMNLFRELRTDYPLCSWGVCINPEKRDILSSLLYRENFILLLYPLSKETISVAVQKLMQAVFKVRIQDTLFNGLRVLHHSYRWTSKEIEVQAVAHHLARQLKMAGFAESVQKRDSFALAIEEALINAVEHGNLEMDSSMKEEDILGLKYEEEKQRRKLDPAYGERILSVELSADRDRAKLEIVNEGPEFNYSYYLENMKNCIVEDSRKASGKGLWLINNIFDDMIFTRGGKSLTLVKEKMTEELYDSKY